MMPPMQAQALIREAYAKGDAPVRLWIETNCASLLPVVPNV